MAMTREELFKQVLGDMGVQVGESTEAIYQAAKDEGLTTTGLDAFRGDEIITREEAALVLGRGLGDTTTQFGGGVEAAMESGLYQGFAGGSAGTGQEAFYTSYYDGRVGESFRSAFAALNSTGTSGASGDLGDSGENVLGNEDALEAQRLQDADNALEIIKDKLREYGLEGLADQAYNMLLDGVSAEAVVLRLRESDEFKNRFSGMQMRRENGMSAISPAEYISLERSYRNVMMTAGIPEGFYDSPDDFAAFIGNDVSQAEMTERVAMAATAVQSIDPNLKTQLQDLYGIGVENDGELTAYYLDPQRGTDIIEQRLQLEAAGLSAASVGTLGSGFESDTAERLVDLNIQQREITERFKGQRAVTQQLVGEADAMSASEFAAAEFGFDSDAVADLAQLRGQRQQRGVRQTGSLVTQRGAIGLGSAT